MIKCDLYTSCVNFEFDDIVFDHDTFCNDHDDRSNMLVIEFFKSANLGKNLSHPFGWKCDSEKLQYKPRSSKFQSFNKFLE